MLYRGTGPGFTSAETRWLAATARPIAAALKRRLAAAAVTGPGPGPGVLALVPGAAPVALSPPGEQWLDILAQPPWGQSRVEVALNAVAALLVVDIARPLEVLPLLARAYSLTHKEQAVAELVMRGLSSKAIADQLRITRHTVGDHLKAVYRKTGSRGRGQLRHTLALEAW